MSLLELHYLWELLMARKGAKKTYKYTQLDIQLNTQIDTHECPFYLCICPFFIYYLTYILLILR